MIEARAQSHNKRIAPIYIVPHHGWAITDEHEHKVLMHGQYQPHGNHGYDNAEHDMQAFFVAHGPFAERVKARRRRDGETLTRTIPPFENTELFGLVAKMLDLEDLPPNNSTRGFWDAYF